MEFILNEKLILKNLDKRAVQEIKNSHLTIDNKEYYTLSRLGKWTGNTPQKITFYEESDDKKSLICPRGFADQAYAICKNYHLKKDINIIDKRVELPPVDTVFNGQLKDFQKGAANAIIKKDHGVLSAVTGTGKTVIALFTIAQRRQPTLVVVHSIELMNQWIERISTFLNILPEEIGVVGSGKYIVGDKITVGLYQSIRKNIAKLNPLFGNVVVDECHKSPSKTFTEAVAGFRAKYRLGLTATAYRRDGLDKLIELTLGDLRYKIEKAPLIETGDISRAEVICRFTQFDTMLDASVEYPKVLKAISLDLARNHLICQDIASEDTDGIKLVLTDRREHAQLISTILELKYKVPSRVLTGVIPKNQRDLIVQELNQGKITTLIATGQLIGEGFDLSKLSTLFLVTPIKFRGRLIQYIGRILRPAAGKSMALIYDYIDINVGVLKASAITRIKTYRQEGIFVNCDI
ncbi:MAG: DEAD/DEAH box helicase [Desulfamplus sp.]|nr:DEAD/DEAH box helicase [Desulfamplus sp.]